MKRSFDDCVSEVSSSSSYEPNGMMLMTTSIANNINANTSINSFSNNFNGSDNLFMDHTIIDEEDSPNTQNDDMCLLVGMAQKKIKKNSSLSYYRNHDNYRYQPSLLTMNGCLGMKTSQSEFELIGCIGSYGSQNGQFKNPSDVAIDFTNQLVFVVDTDNRRIQVFDESTLTFKYMFVTPYKPNAVTVHWDHTLIISFTRDSMICKYDFNGNEIWSWGGISTKNIMDSPTGVVVDYEGNIYVCDWFLHQILVFSPSGELLRSIGSVGKENGQFSFPRDIDMDSAGNIVVSDSGNNRIQILKSNGEFISSFGSLGNDKGEFQAPNSVFVDKSTGNIFLTEWDSHRISKFHPSNPFLGSTCIGSYGNLENSLKYPSGIAFCYGSSRLFCVDCGNSRIKVYRVA